MFPGAARGRRDAADQLDAGGADLLPDGQLPAGAQGAAGERARRAAAPQLLLLHHAPSHHQVRLGITSRSFILRARVDRRFRVVSRVQTYSVVMAIHSRRFP